MDYIHSNGSIESYIFIGNEENNWGKSYAEMSMAKPTWACHGQGRGHRPGDGQEHGHGQRQHIRRLYWLIIDFTVWKEEIVGFLMWFNLKY